MLVIGYLVIIGAIGMACLTATGQFDRVINHPVKVSFKKKLYHMTSITRAVAILKAQEMLPGLDGLCGAGIYFEPDRSKRPDKAHRHGVILSAKVDLGKILVVQRSEIRGDEDWEAEVAGR
jgi:hypothetical protein